MYLTRTIIFLLVLILATPALSAQRSVENIYQEARRHYYTLFSSQKKMQKRSEWLRVISKFSLITKNRPNTKRGRDAQYTMGLLYKKLYQRSKNKSDRKNAITSFQRVIKNYPKSSLVDDADRHIGDIKFKDSDYASAAKSYQKIQKRRLIRRAVSPRKVSYSKTRPARVTPPAVKNSNSPFAHLHRIQWYSRSGYTRIILHLSKRTAFRAQELKNPERVFIDILGASPTAAVSKKTAYKSGLVRSIRMGRNSSSVTRVVFDLAANSYHKVTSLPDPFRIVIDFGLKSSTPPPVIAKKRSKPKGNKVKRAKLTTKSRQSKPFTIVIDPGHGGKDPGAIGPSGLREKHIVLSLSKKLKAALQRKMKCRVILTRSYDRFIELDERTVIANSAGADLFVSMHVNASRNRRAKGLETYFLSPARSKDEMETAARENMLAMKSRNKVENDLAYIMADLENTQKINDSVKLARSTQRSMVKGLRKKYRGVKDLGVKQAMFYVLWNANMPSVLVESSFISNRGEEKRLRSSSYQNRLANSIADGIVNYTRTYQTAMKR